LFLHAKADAMPFSSVTVTPSEDHSAFAPRFALFMPMVGCIVLALMSWLYIAHSMRYGEIIDLWMDVPYPEPFLDLHFVTAGIECRTLGVDVYLHDPCDPLGRLHNYSPLWLRFVFLPTGHEWLNWLGLGLLGCFLISIGFVQRSRRVSDRVLFGLAMLSSSSLFAFERGNLDLLMFIFAVVAVVCFGYRLPVRLCGYAVILLAGLLKFYPMVLFGLALRERPKMIVSIGAVVGAALVSFYLVFRDELPRMAINLPDSFPPGQGWGAKGLARALNDLFPDILATFGYRAAWLDRLPETHLVAYAMLVVLLAASLLCALHLGHRNGVAAALNRLSPPDRRFLVAGAALICGCFFLGQSLPYRAIHLLLALPGLLILAHASTHSDARRVFRWTVAGVLLVLWQVPPRRLVAWVFGGEYFPVDGPVVNYAAWVIVELAWWWVVTVLLAILFWFVASVGQRPRIEQTS
jgi:hypothetical protein